MKYTKEEMEQFINEIKEIAISTNERIYASPDELKSIATDGFNQLFVKIIEFTVGMSF